MMSLLFNILSRFVIAFLSRSQCLLIYITLASQKRRFWVQTSSTLELEGNEVAYFEYLVVLVLLTYKHTFFSLLFSLLSYLLPLHMLLCNSSFTSSCLFHILQFCHTNPLNDPNVSRKPGAPEFLPPSSLPMLLHGPPMQPSSRRTLSLVSSPLYSAGKTFSNVFLLPLPFLFSAAFHPVYGYQLSLSLMPLYSNHSSHSFA